MDDVVLRFCRQHRPAFEIEGRHLSVHRARHTHVKEGERTLHGGDVNRLIVAIEYQNGRVDHRASSPVLAPAACASARAIMPMSSSYTVRTSNTSTPSAIRPTTGGFA